MSPTDLEDLLRAAAPQVLGALVRRHEDFGRCEDAVQEALLAASRSWPVDGVPASPHGWLVTVAGRRLIDGLRSDAARERREVTAAQQVPAAEVGSTDDSLALLFLCCHPALTPASQLALTLRAVGGLTTEQIATALQVPTATVVRRITRAKQAIRDAGARFTLPDTGEPGGRDEFLARLDVVHQVVYLIFTEGHTAGAGEDLHRPDLCAQALRLARSLHARLPSSTETSGLLALMLLVHSRHASRISDTGELVPLAEQDRSRWNPSAIAEGCRLVTEALSSGPVGAYQLQAAVAALHAEADGPEATDWTQIVALYEVLERLTDNPFVTLNRALAVGMSSGPEQGLELLAAPALDALRGHHRLEAARAFLLERSGAFGPAAKAYREAARQADNLAERRHLAACARRLHPHS